jgi:hypothetical protein
MFYLRNYVIVAIRARHAVVEYKLVPRLDLYFFLVRIITYCTSLVDFVPYLLDKWRLIDPALWLIKGQCDPTQVVLVHVITMN